MTSRLEGSGDMCCEKILNQAIAPQSAKVELQEDFGIGG